jgi:FtsZ-interacting cell division protein ZipA
MNLLDPYDIGYTAWVIFAIIVVGGIAVGIATFLHALWASREKRDGKR